jgi:hypothetical protein
VARTRESYQTIVSLSFVYDTEIMEDKKEISTLVDVHLRSLRLLR